MTTRAGRRWAIHLTLILSLVVALIALLPGMPWDHRLVLHEVIGVVFFWALGVHLAQRRRTIRAMVRRAGALGLQLSADTFLAAAAFSALVSGLVDWRRSFPYTIPFLHGLPPLISFWHRLSVLVLLVALVRHVLHRRRRLRTSQVE